MPYIRKEDRERLVELEYPGADNPVSVNLEADNAGELNFAITEVCLAYYEQHGKRYQQVNDVLGALEGAKLEFYRRVAAPYEDKKIEENGDVYNV